MKGRLYVSFCLILSALALKGQVADSLKIYMPQDTLRAFSPADSVHFYRDADTLSLLTDTLVLREFDYEHSPRKALMHALVLPGLGQAYNRKYYKIPIVYGAFAGVAYAINFNTVQYKLSIKDYLADPGDDRAVEYWRRNMELSYIGLVVVYALQVLDAYVDAQLYNWDVNDQLSLRVQPTIQPLSYPMGQGRPAYGLTCSFALKRP